MRALLALLLVASCGTASSPDGGAGADGSHAFDGGVASGDRFISQVLSTSFGEGAGFGQSRMPDVVLGPPQGGGQYRGSLDVLSLGHGGTITVQLSVDAVDGEGVDFIVFENAFRITGSTEFYREPAEISVSDDGSTFVSFPCAHDQPSHEGCAGLNPVFASGVDGGISPFDVEHAGGDPFDLANVGLTRVRFVRITDKSTAEASSNQAGFDLDAIAVLNAANP